MKQGKTNATLQSLHADLVRFKEMPFLPQDTKAGLSIAIEQVERYMFGDLKAAK